MSEVHVRENESLESALKRFKRSCAKSGVLAEVRKREHYESPSVKRRKKSEAARKNRKKFYWDLKPNGERRWAFVIRPAEPPVHASGTAPIREEVHRISAW